MEKNGRGGKILQGASRTLRLESDGLLQLSTPENEEERLQIFHIQVSTIAAVVLTSLGFCIKFYLHYCC